MINPHPSGVLARGFRLQRAPLGTSQRVLNLRFRRALRHQRWYPKYGQCLAARAYATDMFPPEGSPLHRPSSNGDRRRFVDKLFSAIQAKDHWKAVFLILKLNKEDARAQLIHLPAMQFAEVLQSIDPTKVHHQIDVLDGIRITPGMMGHTFAKNMVDENGVRKIYLDLLSQLEPIVKARVEARIPTPASVFTVLFRLGGACSHPDYAADVLSMLKGAGESDSDFRGALGKYTVLNEFLKARFLTEPLYYQYDMERVRARPRNIHGHTATYTNRQVKALDKLWLSVRHNQGHWFRVEPVLGFHDLNKTICSSKLVNRLMPISRLMEAGVSEELLCTAVVASSRAGSSHHARLLLNMFYGIKATVDKSTGEITVDGGIDIPQDSPIRPTKRLLMAIARGLGTSGELDLAVHLIGFISRRYDIAVSHDIWSEWLGWAYVHGSKPAQTEWKIVKDARRMYSPRQIPMLLDVLSKGSHDFQPGFADLVTIARHHIMTSRLLEARDIIRRARAEYDKLVLELEKTAIREAAFRSAEIDMGLRTLPALQKRRDAALYTLQNLCRSWLISAGEMTRYKKEAARNLRVAGVLIPDFVVEFEDVLPQRITYSIPGGDVCIHRPVSSVWLKSEVVESPPATLRVRTAVPISGQEYVDGNEEDVSGSGDEIGGEDVPVRWFSETIVLQHTREKKVRYPLTGSPKGRGNSVWKLDHSVVSAHPLSGVSVGDR